MSRTEGEPKDPEGTKYTNHRENIKRNFYRVLFLGNMLLGATNCSRRVVKDFSSEDAQSDFEPKLTEVLSETEIVELIGLEDDFSSIHLPLEEHLSDTAIELELIEEIDFETEEKIVMEEVLNEEVKEILSLQPELCFDKEGDLLFRNDKGLLKPVLTIETDRHLHYPYEVVKDVRFFVIHYDGAPHTFLSGKYRTVLGTVRNGLNAQQGYPSVHFCVDSYPVTDGLVEDEGLGIILSQAVNTTPFRGRHVTVGIELATGREDITRIKTAKMYEELGVGSSFVEFVSSGSRDVDGYSLGVEQVGANYSKEFPINFPPKQQIANMLSLSKAVATRYGLTAWDIVGHHEIQEKSDPGDEYMLTLRYLLGVSCITEGQDLSDGFLETEDIYEYFSNLKKYSISRMGEKRYGEWDKVYGMDAVLKFLGGGVSILED